MELQAWAKTVSPKPYIAYTLNYVPKTTNHGAHQAKPKPEPPPPKASDLSPEFLGFVTHLVALTK